MRVLAAPLCLLLLLQLSCSHTVHWTYKGNKNEAALGLLLPAKLLRRSHSFRAAEATLSWTLLLLVRGLHRAANLFPFIDDCVSWKWFSPMPPLCAPLCSEDTLSGLADPKGLNNGEKSLQCLRIKAALWMILKGKPLDTACPLFYCRFLFRTGHKKSAHLCIYRSHETLFDL